MSILYKGINHFKLSIEGDAVEAKAYAALALLPALRRLGG